jgi:6-phosphogluconate dehydrogenase (decarboxylating)
MKIGMVGLWRMGPNVVRSLLGAGHERVAIDVHHRAPHHEVKAGATARRP